MLQKYPGSTAVITGAASGLGRALAKELAIRECRLALIDVDAPKLAEVTEELAQFKVFVTAHCADTGSEPAMQHVATEIVRMHGKVHLLINNAAVSATCSFTDTRPADFEWIMRVNFLGVVHGCRAFLPYLLDHGEGQIVNVASCFAWLGYPGKTAYASSKAAVRAFSESLRLELAARGVGVTLLYPGPLQTGLVRRGICDSESRREREEKFLKRRAIPIERVSRRCLDDLLMNPGRIVIGLDYRLMDLLARFSPGLASRAMAVTAARTGF